MTTWPLYKLYYITYDKERECNLT